MTYRPFSVGFAVLLAACGAKTPTGDSSGTPGTSGPTGGTGTTGTAGRFPVTMNATAALSDTSNDGKTLCEKLGWTWDTINNYCVAAVAKGLEGPQGKPGIRFRRGLYTPAMNAEVVAGDVVRGPSGSTYIALVSTPTSTKPSNTPGTGMDPTDEYADDGEWSLLVPRGGPGPAGPVGPPGLGGSPFRAYDYTNTELGVVVGLERMDGMSGRRHITLAENWGGASVRLVRRNMNTAKIQTATLSFVMPDCSGAAYLMLNDLGEEYLLESPFHSNGILYTTAQTQMESWTTESRRVYRLDGTSTCEVVRVSSVGYMMTILSNMVASDPFPNALGPIRVATYQ